MEFIAIMPVSHYHLHILKYTYIFGNFIIPIMAELTRTLPASWYCNEPLYQMERKAVFLKVCAWFHHIS